MSLLVASGLAAAASGVGAALFFHPHSPWGRPVTRLASGRVALTFDDGPSAEWTPAVLDRLAAADVRASFFVLADEARAQPAIVRRMVAEGHRVEVHGGRHRYAFLSAPAALTREIADAAQTVTDLTGRAPRWFRPPYGARPLDPRSTVAGLRIVTWSWSTGDWAGGAQLEEPVRPVTAGAIVLLHDGATPASTARARTLRALDVLIDATRNTLGPLPDPEE